MDAKNSKPTFSKRSSIEEESTEQPDVHEARKGLLKAMVSHRMAPMFSSGPMDFCDESGRSSATSSMFSSKVDDSERKSSVSNASLTPSEQAYLERLLHSADPRTIRRASDRLSDETIFPLSDERDQGDSPPRQYERRDSKVQQELFRLHERGTSMKPSEMLRRISSTTVSTAVGNSDFKKQVEGEDEARQTNEEETVINMADPFSDVHSWLDGNQGVEVGHDGETLSGISPPFQILGTAANDVSCHPHVLSPPLMEGIQAFMPESLAEAHFWLKYSLVRDGPGLFKLLRNVRGSVHTVVAIETTEGYVFGSFTSRPWRLSSGRYFGSKESFLWRMRQSRLTPCDAAAQQAAMEGELDVFPYVQSNNSVQRCNRDGISLGRGELKDDNERTGSHYGSALSLNAKLTKGSTSTSETFANPCLTSVNKRGDEFIVSNVEVWTMTPYNTVTEAEDEELSMLFFEETHDRDRAKLDIVGILLGSPYGHT